MSNMPSKDEILQWVADNPTLTSKRDIGKAFGIKGAARFEFKALLREMQADGLLQKHRKTFRDPDRLPPVSVLEMLGPDTDGDLFARPLEWHGEGKEPTILMLPRDGDPALGKGDRILARLTEIENEPHNYEARLIRRIGQTANRLLGIFRKRSEGGRILPIDKGSDREWLVPEGATFDAKDGELVEAEQSGPRSRMGLPKARIVARLGDPTAPRAVSLIAIHQHGIPDEFPGDVIAEADGMKPAGLGERTDLRDLPLITIDPADARDHDDAVCAMPDDDPKNKGGHIVWVAIADVAHYVTPGSALDMEARKRGNSSYFPDRVVPMLPDRLSGDLCSLHEGVPRACIAVEMRLNAAGEKMGHRFVRGLMRSPASLNYAEVQAAIEGDPNDKTAPFVEDVLKPLYAAYAALQKARAARQPLNLDLPERKVVLDDDGQVTSVAFSDRLDAHKLIEECMVLANVAAAEVLIAKQTPLLFRVHEEPPAEKLESLRDTAEAAGLNFAKGQVLKTQHLNQLLDAAAHGDEAELINLSVLRSMTQAYYSPKNFGHFGLALKSYGHFTSPIRRYADLIVHRALITAHGWGEDGLTPWDIEKLEPTGTHISETERRSMMAERDTTDRYLAAFLSERVGSDFTGRISGIAKFGVFVKLDETGADGLIPMRNLGNEYWVHDRDTNTLMGSDTGRIIGLGQRVVARLTEAAPVTGGLALELLEIDGEAVHRGPKAGGRSRKPVKRRVVKAKRKSDKLKRKKR